MTTPLLIAIIIGLYILIAAPLVIFPCMLASRRDQDKLEKRGTKSKPGPENIIFVLDKSDLRRELFQDGEIAT
ncbi:MAG: hypothetical protein MUO67_24290 [Anaerolineales bacterium]|jgi:hypothetical protein|nr:hypothetical protein [Anaerolineales bacterium]